MEHERQILRVGAAAIGAAIVFRLVGGLSTPVQALLTKPDAGAFALYLESGRVVRPTGAAVTEPSEAATQALTLPATEPTVYAPQRAAFSEADAALLDIDGFFDYTPDAAALLGAPLAWSLRQEEPTVLILHTHTTESYTKQGEDYTESAAYRTTDERYNMVSIGDRLAELLEAQGIRVVHDRTMHDYPSYSGSYADARETAREYLSRYPQICLIIDLHRDAAEDAQGDQVAFTVQSGQTQAAQLLLVVGSNEGGLEHPNWEKNLALAAKLQVMLEKQSPGITRGVCLSTQRYNQDLSVGALLVEVGAAGNTHAQALASMDALAQSIGSLADGTQA